MGSRVVEVAVPGSAGRRLSMHLHESHDQYISEEIAGNGIWESLETTIILRLLQPGELLVDCGANIGWYSMMAAAMGAQVMAFEPEPGNLALLKANIGANSLDGFVEIHGMALGRRAGTSTLQLSSFNQGDHRVSALPVGETVTIGVEVLDDKLGSRTPTVIKLDTQGSEVAILRGAAATLSGERVGDISLVIEYWPYGLQDCGASAEELIGLLTPIVGVSHDCFDLDEWKGVLRPITLVELARMAASGAYSPAGQGYTNLLVLPKHRRASIDDLLAPETVAESAPVAAGAEPVAESAPVAAEAESVAADHAPRAASSPVDADRNWLARLRQRFSGDTSR